MQYISWFGDETFIVGILCVIALGVDFKRGFILLQIVLATYISTDLVKTLFALPRPAYLDARLSDFGDLVPGLQPLQAAAAKSFFGALPESSIIAYRDLGQGPLSFGFPSGHTSSAVALWGGLALMYRKKGLACFAVLMVILMMASRLYLARHFLADVLGGVVVGSAVLALAALLIRNFEVDRLYEKQTYNLSAGHLSALWLYGAGLGLPILILLSGEGFIGRVSALLGLNLAFLLLTFGHVPMGGGSIWHRMARVLIGFALFFAVNAGVKLLPLNHGGSLYILLKGGLPPFILFLGACFLVSLFMRKGPGAGIVPPEYQDRAG